ncbi:MAG: glycoside hydrolase family 44 protein [Acidimicrobiales bacterium]|jgi:hypothetical protein
MSATVTFDINTTEQQRAISPLIYGMNLDKTVGPTQFAEAMAEARPGMVRMGGDRWTAYNWEDNDSNAGSDYEYENDDYLSSSTSPGAAVLPTIEAAEKAGIPVLLTVPIAGYVSADRDPPGPVQNSGTDYLKTRFKVDEPTAPNPLTTTPNDTLPDVYQDQYVYWLTKTVPHAHLMFSLDNEPDLWSSTHSEIHPGPTTYTELLSKDLAYAAAIKKVDPEAPVTGPVSYGWEGYETLQNAPGSAKYGNFLDWWMRHVRAADTAAGTTLINDLDLHWYPEATGGGQRVTGTGISPAEAAAREQAPRSLWDPSYVEDSWITQDSLDGHGIDLIPRLGAQIAANNPGMNLDFSEWDYGAGQAISGAIATADVLGIFGRYGVHAAAFWPLTSDEGFAYGAFAIYRDYNGRGAAFGDTEVRATTTDKVNTSVYASVDKADPRHVVIVVINKSLGATTATVRLQGVAATTASVYELTSKISKPEPAPALVATGSGTFNDVMPAQSVSVIVPQSGE